MKRFLVVANLTLGGEHLLERVRACLSEGPCSFHILVPASTAPASGFADRDSDLAAASTRLEDELARFRELGAEATGEIGDHRPEDAILDVLSRESFDEIILSTLPPGVSRWLGLDLISRVERAVDVPVTHIIAEAESQGAGPET